MGATAATVSIETWSQVGYVFDFDGTNTTLQLYVNGGTPTSVTLSSMYIDDKTAYVDAWLMMTRSSTSGELYMWGFMYSFTLANEANTSYITSNLNSSTCSGSCSICASDRNICFHDSQALEVFWNGTADAACLKDCESSEGCVRAEDCNLCHDRFCADCINFDNGATCTACIANAGNSGLAPCSCNDGYFFNEETDSCDQCHANCATCEDFKDNSSKFCSTCKPGFYKQRGSSAINTCLGFCPTGETANDVSNECDGTDKIVFDVILDTWSQNFLEVYDSIDNIPFYLSSNQGSYSESPYLVPASTSCSKTFYFDGVDDHMNTFGNGNALLLGHSTSLSVWAKLDAVDTTGTLFSKVNSNGDERFKVNAIDGNWGLGFAEGDIYNSTSTTVINNDNWNLITFVVNATGGHSSTLEIYGNNGSLLI